MAFSPHLAIFSVIIRFRFHASATRFHSWPTFSMPRNRNGRKFITCLMMPNTGSTVCLRKPESARPAFVLRRCAMVVTASAPADSAAGSVQRSSSGGWCRSRFMAMSGSIPASRHALTFASLKKPVSASNCAGSPAGSVALTQNLKD